jgi:hypothetical protein
MFIYISLFIMSGEFLLIKKKNVRGIQESIETNLSLI